ncbi:hypothetical protein CLV92_1271 [Kineococcus xinjiangensis]|uniref:Uncharacterized protein n=1 Tax=Kineococcus xinjiangensis TaxID=512762 RepID=A0A2S6IBX8_9ACTN|nr:hypothetical protein [Kineococcus xinjiangensis]PPK90181.1 hypothetical protein CLV92_1271 [Kineococcus xinjiangensis]
MRRLQDVITGLVRAVFPPHEEPTWTKLATLAGQELFDTVLASCPPQWRHCVNPDEDLAPEERFMPMEQMLQLASVSRQRRDGQSGEKGEEWCLSLLDEWGVLVDLRLEEDEEDPVVTHLLAHPGVVDAYHQDTEAYYWITHIPMTTARAGALALSAVHAAHRHALHRAGLGPAD